MFIIPQIRNLFKYDNSCLVLEGKKYDIFVPKTDLKTIARLLKFVKLMKYVGNDELFGKSVENQ